MMLTGDKIKEITECIKYLYTYGGPLRPPRTRPDPATLQIQQPHSDTYTRLGKPVARFCIRHIVTVLTLCHLINL